MIWKKLVEKGKPSSLLLIGYGAYGICKETRFSMFRLSLLDRGFIVGLPHIRGGSEMGRRWYEEGKLLHKMTSFNDFIACCEYLIEKKYTEPAKLAVKGRSAGGLLVGAAAILRPDLFHCIIAEVAFLDVIVSMSDCSIPWTSYDFNEWGNANIKEHYEYMKQYCPITNITQKSYPHMLLTTCWNDARVPFWEPAKFVAKMRAHKVDNNLLLLNTTFDGGHFTRNHSLFWAFLHTIINKT